MLLALRKPPSESHSFSNAIEYKNEVATAE